VGLSTGRVAMTCCMNGLRRKRYTAAPSPRSAGACSMARHRKRREGLRLSNQRTPAEALASAPMQSATNST
jgi:hypothetical protein